MHSYLIIRRCTQLNVDIAWLALLLYLYLFHQWVIGKYLYSVKANAKLDIYDHLSFILTITSVTRSESRPAQRLKINTGIYILAICCSNLKTGKNLKEDLKKGREKGRKKEKCDKTHVKISLCSLNDRKKIHKNREEF